MGQDVVSFHHIWNCKCWNNSYFYHYSPNQAIVDIIVQGYTLHAVYGWSIHLLGALWSSVSHLLLHLARTPTNPNNMEMGDMEAAEQLTPIKDSKSAIQIQNKEKPTSSHPFFKVV